MSERSPEQRLRDNPAAYSWGGLIERDRVLTLALIDHRYGIAPLTAEQFVGHTLAALAVRTEIAEYALSGGWVMAREALAGGATAEQTATAMGLDPDALRTGLIEWADGQRRFGLITDAEHAAVLALMTT